MASRARRSGPVRRRQYEYRSIFTAQPLSIAGLVLVAVFGVWTDAHAKPAKVDGRQLISGPNPFPGGGCPADELARAPTDARGESPDEETEPSLAVNPKNPLNLVATWQIGHSPKTTVYGATVSHDGGVTWRLAPTPGLSLCTGGDVFMSQDPGISVGPDGVAYLASQGVRSGSRVLVNRSVDDGNTWSAPVEVTPEGTVDKQRAPVVGDPRVPGRAYVVWTNLRDLATGDVFISRTTDGGATWFPPQPVFIAPFLVRPFQVLPEVLPNGALLVVSTLVQGGNYVNPDADQQRHDVVAMSSQDEGLSWSTPRRIAQTGPLGPHLRAEQPDDTEKVIINLPHSQFTAGADGTAYVVWHDIVSPSTSKVLLAVSRDRGETWSDPRVVVAHRSHALMPNVAVMSDGTVGVSWYDTRRDKHGDNELTTDYWFAHTHDHGLTWNETRVAGPFDLRKADDRNPGPNAFAFGLGEYFGLAALPNGFATTFAMTDPPARFGPSDVFYAGIQIP